MITRAKDNIYKPKVFHSSVTNETFEPSTYKQAMAHPHWLHVMQVEYDALMHNNTWTFTSQPSGANSVRCKWVFKRKYKPEGLLQRYKAQLVAKGFH